MENIMRPENDSACQTSSPEDEDSTVTFYFNIN